MHTKPWKKHWFPHYNLYSQTIIRRNLYYPLKVLQFLIENFLPLQVPSAVTHVLFWQRYFYKVHQLQQVWFSLFEVGICYLIEVLCNSCNIALVLRNKTSKLVLEWKLVLCIKNCHWLVNSLTNCFIRSHLETGMASFYACLFSKWWDRFCLGFSHAKALVFNAFVCCQHQKHALSYTL